MQTIDPFRPARPTRPASTPPPHPRMSGTAQQSVPRSVVRQSPPTATSGPQAGARFTKLASQKKTRHIPWPTIIAVLASALLVPAAYFGIVGMGIVVVGVIAALALRQPSRLIFITALMGLLYVIGLQFSGNVKNAQAVAGLVYILFVGGGIGFSLEVRRDKVWFKKH